METPSPATDQAIKKHIYRDLRPNPWTLHGKLAAAYAAGTLASLSVCTQFGLGLTPWSKAMQMLLMELGQLGCIVACGFFFALFPLIALRVITPPLQFRVIWRQHSMALGGWFLLTELVLLGSAGFGAALLESLIWTASATATLWVGAFVFDRYALPPVHREGLPS